MDEKFIKRALELADIAEKNNEVPVGAVIVDSNNNIVGEGYNQNIINNDPSAHAEIIALRNAALKIKNHRLVGCKLYVTLEPCMMCLGAIIHSRIQTVIYSASDSKTGCLGGKIDLNNESYGWNHKIEVIPNISQEESSIKLKTFFKNLRLEKKLFHKD